MPDRKTKYIVKLPDGNIVKANGKYKTFETKDDASKVAGDSGKVIPYPVYW